MALDAIGREFGEQGRVSNHIESTRYVLGYGSDFMSGIEDLPPLFGEQKQHIHGGMTWSESKLMIGNQTIGEEEDEEVSCGQYLDDDKPQSEQCTQCQ